TITSSTFRSRLNLSSYDDGRYLLSELRSSSIRSVSRIRAHSSHDCRLQFQQKSSDDPLLHKNRTISDFLLPDRYKRSMGMTPLFVDATSSYSMVFSLHGRSRNGVIIHLKREGKREWKCRALQGADDQEILIMIPDTEIAVTAGTRWTRFFSLSENQNNFDNKELAIM
ncbi:hypothetical protein PMAYCL1PPCAC_20203, partial [Pristionchus mayeri]